jgi:hypothetical protein
MADRIPHRKEVNPMVAIGNGTLALPRLALHRETVVALAGGRLDAVGKGPKGPKPTRGKQCNTQYCSLQTCPSIVDICA